MKLDKKHENRIEFVAEVEIPFANLIRRYALSRIPVLAIDSVTFYENRSALWDEYISHRIGLIPIITPEKVPHSTEVTFVLDSEGPKMANSSEMKSSDSEIVPAQNIPLITLGQNQRIKLEGKAVLGTAQKHAKFQAGLVSYGQNAKGKGLNFVVESFYQMSPQEMIKRTCEVVLEDVDKLIVAIK